MYPVEAILCYSAVLIPGNIQTCTSGTNIYPVEAILYYSGVLIPGNI